MTDAGESEHPTSGAPRGHGGEPAHAGLDTAGWLIKAGVAVIAIFFIGYGLYLGLVIAAACAGGICPDEFYFIPIIPIIPGLLVIWVGRGALRGNLAGLIVVALTGAAMVAVALLPGVQAILWAVQYARLDAAMLPAFIIGLVGVMLLAGVAGRLSERRRMTRSRLQDPPRPTSG
jgi:predicted phage tail protein